MLVTTHYATIRNGLATTASPIDTGDTDAVKTATLFGETTESWTPKDFVGPGEPHRFIEVEVTSYVGRVLETFLREERVMSDVWDMVRYATVYTSDGDFKTVGAGSRWTVDASPELVAKWTEHKKLVAEFAKVKERVAAKRRAAREAKIEAATPRKGKIVKVVKGRKVPCGTTGTVVWYGEGKRYNRYSGAAMRVGVKDSSGTVHWTAASNVAVLDANGEVLAA